MIAAGKVTPADDDTDVADERPGDYDVEPSAVSLACEVRRGNLSLNSSAHCELLSGKPGRARYCGFLRSHRDDDRVSIAPCPGRRRSRYRRGCPAAVAHARRQLSRLDHINLDRVAVPRLSAGLLK